MTKRRCSTPRRSKRLPVLALVLCSTLAPSSASASIEHPPPPSEIVCDGGDQVCESANKPTTPKNDGTAKTSNNKQQFNHTTKDRTITRHDEDATTDDKQFPKKAGKGDGAEDDDDPLLGWLSEQVRDHSKCGIYLAPSTIPGAGLGMFSGRQFLKNEIVTQGDIVVPLSELDWHNGFTLKHFLWEEYTWSSSSFPSMDEENGYASGLQACSPGIGAAINCDLPLVNIIDTYSKIDNGGLHRAKDPGVGGFTPFYDRKSKATRTIQAFEELYIDYGENYFQSRPSTYGLMPLSKNYKEADKLLKRYVDVVRGKSFQRLEKNSLGPVEDDLWAMIKDWPFESRTLNALPTNHTIISTLLDDGGTAWQNYNRSILDEKYMEDYGQCMDNIRPGKSTIPQAGRGAFATRFIPKGGLVAPAPLIHIGDKEELRMYDVLPENEDGLVHRNASAPNHFQLLLNYCFGHPESTMLLSPYGLLTSLINHSPNAANTRIAWTTKPMRNREWMEMEPAQFAGEYHSGLQLDFIALRDIEGNEEITIDYGSAWEQAWRGHVANWEKPPGADKYLPAYALQQQLDLKVLTVDEGGMGKHVHTYCHEAYRRMNYLEPDKEYYHRCRAIERHTAPNGEYRYLVEIYSAVEENNMNYHEVHELLFDVPRDAFLFEDAGYTRDHQMTWSFRHEMGIPDDMFPQAWRNKKAGEK